MTTYTIPAMTTDAAAKWAEVLSASALREIADWCETAADSLRRHTRRAEDGERGALIADCARLEATAGHLRGLILTIESRGA